jgi:hypothetical protein
MAELNNHVLPGALKRTGVSYAGHAALWFNASACALFRAVLPWLTPSAAPREGMEHCTERAPNPAGSTQESGISLRRSEEVATCSRWAIFAG